MPLQEFTFIVDSKGQLTDSVTAQAERVFGKGARFVGDAKPRSGPIRYLKRKGLRVIKEKGVFYLDSDKARRVVFAKIDVPLDYIVKKMGGTPGGVDLSQLETTEIHNEEGN